VDPLTPFFDLGDQISINGEVFPIHSYKINFSSGLVTVDLSAPGGNESDDEFSTKSPIERKLDDYVKEDSEGLHYGDNGWEFGGMSSGGHIILDHYPTDEEQASYQDGSVILIYEA
jgi:hypothetical protein